MILWSDIMPVTTDYKKGQELIQGLAFRKDGSIRQLVLQDQNGAVVSSAFFPPGTFKTDPNWKDKKKYHWIDAFTDEELLDPAQGLIFTKEMLIKLRAEAETANATKTFTVEDINKYKRE